jgi:serine/threonine-protein kinase
MDSPRILADRYELLGHIARGGMADVYEARDSLLGRRVAVKVLHSQFSSDEAFVKRFRREAQAAANLSHPNIVGIYDWGQEGSTYFIVMELVEGKSLRDVLRDEGPLLPRRAIEISAEVAAALSVAHRSGLVHRDVKPGNMLLTPDGTVKVTDFGIARAWDDSSELTKTGAVIGTATYFSPEQAQGSPADERSDIYALGVVMYEMLTGRPPFSGESPVAVAYQHVSSVAAQPSLDNPDIPPDLDRIVMRALDKSPEMRYQTADELRQDLLLFLRGEIPAAVPAGDAPTQVMPPSPVPPATATPDEIYRQIAPPEQTTSQLPFIITTFALVVALGVGIFLLLRALAPGTEEPTTTAVPNVAGMTQTEALLELQQLGFNVIPEPSASDTVEEGRVIATKPPAGEEAEDGAIIIVYVSLGAEAFPVPPVVGQDLARATELIEKAGLVLGTVEQVPDDTAPEGQVISQDPPAGEDAAPETPVNLVVSTGLEEFPIPDDLIGRSEGDVGFILGNLGLEPVFETEFSSEILEGFVVRTEPGGGATVKKGDQVTVFVSEGPEPVEVPNLIGSTEEQARSALEALGLVLRVNATTVEVSPDLDGLVAEQLPSAGTEVEPGTTISVTLGEAPATTTTTTEAGDG